MWKSPLKANLCESIVKKQMRYNRDLEIRKKVNLFFEASRFRSVTLACKKLGYKRTFYYYWWRRLIAADWDIGALSERSRRPKTHPRTTPVRIVRLITKLRKKTGYGPKRIAYYLLKDCKVKIAESTVGRVLKREWLIPPRMKKPAKKHTKRYEMPHPGDLVQIDVKYVPYRIRGQRYYQFTAIDDCTRWRYAAIFDEKSTYSTKLFLEGLLEAAPFKIHCIQTDGGTEFTYRYVSDPKCVNKEPAEHVLDRNCAREGIRHRLIPVATPEINGNLERSHRTDDEEFYRQKRHREGPSLKAAFKVWIDKYNNERPHGGIGMRTPEQRLKEKLAA